MAEYIEREALLHDIEQLVVYTVRGKIMSAEMRGAHKIIERIKCAPAVEPIYIHEPTKSEFKRMAVQEWISVKDRLPEEKVNCIVYYKHAYCNNDGYWAIRFCFYDGEKFQLDQAYKVTHWMLSPQPPKGVNDAESVD